MRTNKRVNILKLSSRSTIEGTRTVEMDRSAIRAWIHFSEGVLDTTAGEQLDTSGTIKIRGNTLKSGSIIEVLPDVTKRYRVEGIEEILSPAGSVSAIKGILVRDLSLEA